MRIDIPLSIMITTSPTPAPARAAQYQSHRGGARSERAGPVRRPGRQQHIGAVYGLAFDP